MYFEVIGFELGESWKKIVADLKIVHLFLKSFRGEN
jgi:hypothetical protein